MYLSPETGLQAATRQGCLRSNMNSMAKSDYFLTSATHSSWLLRGAHGRFNFIADESHRSGD